jgi:CBS domain-containing protein
MGGIKVNRGGDNPKTVDLKHNGIVPIVDMARVYALSTSLPVANTRDRLDHVTEGQTISLEAARDLRDALDFISDIRVRHQARQIEAKQKPDNFLSLRELSNFERAHLQSAYHIVKSLQETLSNRYQADRI